MRILGGAALGLLLASCRAGGTQPPPDDDVVATALALAAEDTGCDTATGQITHRGSAPLVQTFDVAVTGCGDRWLYQVNCGRAVCEAEHKGDLGPPPPTDASEPPKLPEPVRVFKQPR